jgi:hypothetical protein
MMAAGLDCKMQNILSKGVIKMKLTDDFEIPVSELEAGCIVSDGTMNQKDVLEKEFLFLFGITSKLSLRQHTRAVRYNTEFVTLLIDGEPKPETWEKFGYIRDDITDLINELCPDGWYYGGSPGDPACVGFFPCEEEGI